MAENKSYSHNNRIASIFKEHLMVWKLFFLYHTVSNKIGLLKEKIKQKSGIQIVNPGSFCFNSWFSAVGSASIVLREHAKNPMLLYLI